MKQKLKKIWYIPLVCIFLAAIIRAYRVDSIPQILPSEKRIASADQWEMNEVQNEEYLEYEYCIPAELGSEVILSIRGAYPFVSVLLDGQEIYTYADTFMERGMSWKWVDLPENMTGHTVTLRFFLEKEKYNPIAGGNVLLGDKNTIYLQILKTNRFALLCGTLTFLVGLVISVGAVVMRKRVTADVWKGIHYLGIFLWLAGVWLITDSSVLQFVTGKVSVVVLLSFLSFMLMPYFLLRFIRKMMIYRTKGLMLLAYLHLVNAAICMFLYLFQLVPLQKSLIGVHVLIVISACAIIKSALQEVHKHKNNEMKVILAGLTALIIFLVIAIGRFYANVMSYYAFFYGVGIIVFEISLLGAAIERLRYFMDASANVEEYREFAHKDTMTQMGNRTAFTKQQELGSWKENRSYIVLDINNLKMVNDTYGHQAGDQLIIDAAGCIMEAFKEKGGCYRIGGDEFVVILHTDSVTEVLEGLRRMEQAIAHVNQTRDVPVEIAYGYSVRRSQNVTAQELFNIADANMYARKRQMKKKK